MKDYFVLTEADKKYLRDGEVTRENFLSKYATGDFDAIYPTGCNSNVNCSSILRPPFSRDTDKIMNCPLYNRYADKTQVLSFYKNDNITRRASHVQFVSRIARLIGRALRLNLDLIEAIALGHDIGHTPFGHKGEEFLSAWYQAGCIKRGREIRYFNHNVQSARYFRCLTTLNYSLSLQTLSGILSHNDEKVCKEYSPDCLVDFAEFDAILERCITDNGYHKTLRPNTLEGCVVRLSDMIAYVGKDRQGLWYVGLEDANNKFKGSILGNNNSEIISNMITNIVKNSIESPSLNIDEEVFDEFKGLIDDNYRYIYKDPVVTENYAIVNELMKKLYEYLCDDMIANGNKSWTYQKYFLSSFGKNEYEKTGNYLDLVDDIVTDYIASMTDDYFIDLCMHLHVGDDIRKKLVIHGYFE